MISTLILRSPIVRGLVIGVTCALMAWYASCQPIFRRLEDWALDGCFTYRGQRPGRGSIILIGLDAASQGQLRKPLAFISPELAEVVEYLERRRAAAIGIDLTVPEDLTDFEGLDAGRLGKVIARHENIILPEWNRSGSWVRPHLQWLMQPESGSGLGGLGFANITEDDDVFVRRQRLLVRDGDAVHEQFALVVLTAAGWGRVEWARGHLHISGRSVPLEPGHALRINYAGPTGTIPAIPFGRVLAAARGFTPGPADFAGRIVIIGDTAPGQDLHATPYTARTLARLVTQAPGLMSGAEIQANIIATLVDGAYITAPRWLWMPPILIVVGALLGVAYARLNLGWAALLMVGHQLGWWAASITAFAHANWRVEVVAMSLLGYLVFGCTFPFRWRWVRHLLGLFKSEPVARILEAGSGRIDSAGRELPVSVLFADIRGFTTFCEHHTPGEVVGLLNSYYTAIVPIIEAYGGTIDQYRGDGIMAIFGEPVACADHAARAVGAAVAMVRCVHERAPLWEDLGMPGMRIGVGIDTGRAFVGTTGSPHRLDYTAHGDSVNAAARIEAANKGLGTEILISASTYQALRTLERETLGCSPRAERVTVKGKALELHRVIIPASASASPI